MKCSKCEKKAIFYQQYSGKHLCEDHFSEDVEKKVKRRIRKELHISGRERIAVALSGGKDSTVLIYLLKKIFSRRRDIEFIALTIDEGIKDYREKHIRKAKKISNELGVDHFLFSFREEYGFTLEDILRKFRDKAEKRSPCSFCGVLRKKLLNKKARELNSTGIATAHNLDDEAQTVLMNYLRGDIVSAVEGKVCEKDKTSR